jgi:urea carboxylase
LNIDVLRAGTMTTIQDWPGRRGLWHVGVPPSGPMDDRSFRLGNVALGNPEGAPGLECTLQGPKLRFGGSATISVCGAPADIALDGAPVPAWTPIAVAAGAVLDVGIVKGPGLRTYVLFAGGLDAPLDLGSAATFTLGRLGGMEGRALGKGDVLSAASAAGADPTGQAEVPAAERPEFTADWQIAVAEGPHAAPDFFTREDIEAFYAGEWEVGVNAARTGVRLAGPRPAWARDDGGEAGLHPSNLHDTPYSVGAINFTGDHPVILGPDGPSLGGFVCPATVVTSERWKLGQLRPGDRVRFVPAEDAAVLPELPLPGRVATRRVLPRDDGILGRREEGRDAPAVTYRRNGDDNLLIEYGPIVLDLGLRIRVHALAERLAADQLPGLIDMTPGVRSLQLHFDPDRLSLHSVVAAARDAEETLPPTGALTVRSRSVRMPLSFDDPSIQETINRYMAGVRDDAPWCPSNIEFIRRINGLDIQEDVRRTMFDAEYLVLGLGDVYLGAPVATPLDPRHRLVTTKYNPTRTYTPESAVGIGGAYLCVYGMEGPGGYQLIGRTVPIWSRSGAEPPWLLRFFDRIRWEPVSAEELDELRANADAGRLPLRVEEGEFSLSEHREFLEREAASIARFRHRQAAAFAAERAAWVASGELGGARAA